VVSAPSPSSTSFDTNRWLMDCHQTAFDEEFNQITAATTAANDLITTGINKRVWNGDLLNDTSGTGNHLDYAEQPHSNSKKMCLNKDNYERDILGLSNDDMSSADMDQMSNDHLVNHHQYNHHHPHHQSQLFVGATGGSGPADAVGNHAMISPNFEEDIHRQVQNAIDSILNLQNNEADTLHFSLDPSMPSFLVESPLSGSVGASRESSTSTTTSQTTPRPPSVAKRKYSQRHPRLDDISDCLIGGGSTLSNSPSPNSMTHTNSSIFTGGAGSASTTQSGPSTSSSASSGVGSGGAEFVGVGSLIDETVKSIITS
jgi:hypothetical protein